MYDLDKIRIFYYTIKFGNLHDAAKYLDISSSAISKHLSKLEKQFHKKLYIYRRYKYDLTEDGKNLFNLAKEIIPQFDDRLSSFITEDHKYSQIIILTTTGIVSLWLADKLKYFFEMNNDITIKIITTNEKYDFDTSDADLAILPKMAFSEDVNYCKIVNFKSKLYASQEYLEKNGNPKNIEELNKHKLIGYYSSIKGIRGDVDWHLTRDTHNQGIRDCRLMINSAFCQIEAARLGLGILAIPNYNGMMERANLVNILPEKEVNMDLYLITRKSQLITNEIESFINFLKQENI